MPRRLLRLIELPQGWCARTWRPTTKLERAKVRPSLRWWQVVLMVGGALGGLPLPAGSPDGYTVVVRLPVARGVQARRSLLAVAIVLLGLAALLFVMWPFVEPSALSVSAALVNLALLAAAGRAYLAAWVRVAWVGQDVVFRNLHPMYAAALLAELDRVRNRAAVTW